MSLVPCSLHTDKKLQNFNTSAKQLSSKNNTRNNTKKNLQFLDSKQLLSPQSHTTDPMSTVGPGRDSS